MNRKAHPILKVGAHPSDHRLGAERAWKSRRRCRRVTAGRGYLTSNQATHSAQPERCRAVCRRGSPAGPAARRAFGLACGTIIVWAATGPLFHYSDTWQLVINTGTTMVTFLMVFLIQRSQNKDSLAMQLKLNELVAAVKGASNRLIDVEDLTEEELRVLQPPLRQARRAWRRGTRV